MANKTPNEKTLKTLTTELQKLQGELAATKRLAIDVKTNQARFERVTVPGGRDTGVGEFYLEVAITATETDTYIPLSIASGKKTTGFMYQIEGSDKGMITKASVKWRGTGITEVTVGTLFYAKIPKGKTALFIFNITTRGNAGGSYRVLITRVNTKQNPSEARYTPYIATIESKSVSFS